MSVSEELFELDAPEFLFTTDDTNCTAVNFGLELGKSGYKSSTNSVIWLKDSAYVGNYHMRIAIRVDDGDSQWQYIDWVKDVAIQIVGDYEQSDILKALQQAGLMTKLTYGTMELKPNLPMHED